MRLHPSLRRKTIGLLTRSPSVGQLRRILNPSGHFRQCEGRLKRWKMRITRTSRLGRVESFCLVSLLHRSTLALVTASILRGGQHSDQHQIRSLKRKKRRTMRKRKTRKKRLRDVGMLLLSLLRRTSKVSRAYVTQGISRGDDMLM
jgi:hypothetical protein